MSLEPSPRGDSLRVLIADDDADVCALVNRVLRPIADVTAVHDAEAAIGHLAGAERYDAIIADYMLPGMNGIAFVARLRALSIAAPVLMISGHERLEPRLREMAIEAGADAFLGKPFTLGQLRATVRRLLELAPRSVA